MKLINLIYKLLSQDESYYVDADFNKNEIYIQREYIQYSPTGDPADCTEAESERLSLKEDADSNIIVFAESGEEIYRISLYTDSGDILFDYDELAYFLDKRIPVIDVFAREYQHRQAALMSALECVA